jgi:hypothetical protein
MRTERSASNLGGACRQALAVAGLALLPPLVLAGCGDARRATPTVDVTPEQPAATRPAGPPAVMPAAPQPSGPLAPTPSSTPTGAALNGVPAVVSLDPPNGATDVDPARPTLSITFDREMDAEGWAYVIEAAETAPDLGESSFDASHRVNTVHARLEPGKRYVVWINSPQYSYFRDRNGTLLPPLRWTFQTRGTAAAAAPAMGTVSAHGAAPPHVVTLQPPNGATAVDPATTVLRATFDRPMAAGWSWVREATGEFPATTGDAYFETNEQTAALPVRLAPGTTYVIWLNSREHTDFRDQAGTAAEPVRWVFTTR